MNVSSSDQTKNQTNKKGVLIDVYVNVNQNPGLWSISGAVPSADQSISRQPLIWVAYL
jgi:hypothetical protein